MRILSHQIQITKVPIVHPEKKHNVILNYITDDSRAAQSDSVKQIIVHHSPNLTRFLTRFFEEIVDSAFRTNSKIVFINFN